MVLVFRISAYCGVSLPFSDKISSAWERCEAVNTILLLGADFINDNQNKSFEALQEICLHEHEQGFDSPIIPILDNLKTRISNFFWRFLKFSSFLIIKLKALGTIFYRSIVDLFNAGTSLWCLVMTIINYVKRLSDMQNFWNIFLPTYVQI